MPDPPPPFWANLTHDNVLIMDDIPARVGVMTSHNDQLPATLKPTALTTTIDADLHLVPALIADAGDPAAWRYVDFFTANIRNPNTRRAYARACSRFFAWCEDRGLTLTTKHIPIALLAFVAPAFAEELPIDPAVTEATIAATICKPGWTKTVRPPIRVTEQIKRDKLRAAGWTDADKDRFELDYIIPLSLGGAPDDPNNFQLEPGNEVAERKALEACLPRLVCERRLMLDEARKAVWRDWRAALGLCRD